MRSEIRLSILIGAALVSVEAFPSGDITALVREGNAYQADMAGGSYYDQSTYPAANAFDGVYKDSGRLLVSPSYAPSEVRPIVVYYTIADSFMPDAAIVADSFVFYKSSAVDRTPTMIRMEGYDSIREKWLVLGGTAESVADEVASKDSWEIPIPRANRVDCRRYRFVITENKAKKSGSAALDVRELVIRGTVVNRIPLAWNGGEGGVWNGANENWLDNAGESCVWQPGGMATIGDSAVTVSGTHAVSKLSLVDAVSHALSGGEIQFVSPAILRVAANDRLTTDLVPCVKGTDSASACAQGTRNADVTYLPRGATDNTGAEVTYWKNRCLADIVGFDSAKIWVYSSQVKAVANHFESDGQVATVQFQCDRPNGEKSCVYGGKVEFRQVGADITARLVYIGYKWDVAVSPSLDLDTIGLTKINVRDADHSASSDGAALYEILAVTDANGGLAVCINNDHVVEHAGNLPPDETNNKTGSPVAYIRNANLSDIAGFESATLICGKKDADVRTLQPYFVTRAEGKLSTQFQCEVPYPADDKVLLYSCKVELTQSGSDIQARLVYVKYNWDTLPIGSDLDNRGTSAVILASGEQAAASSCCVGNIEVSFGGKLHLDGAFGVQGDVGIANGELALGAGMLSVSNSFSGAGALVFEPAGESQSVLFSGRNDCTGGTTLSGNTTVTLARTDAFGTGPVKVGSDATLAVSPDLAAVASTLTLASGSSLSFPASSSLCVDSLVVPEEGTVSIVGELGANTFRVGTGKTLSAAQRKKLRYRGCAVQQTDDGWIVPGGGLILLFR